ncbi:MAG TPA: hypothetical protein VNA25_20450 [Phycisphaerae bacterium]|nr:hypothetical protein [Phycisphaerae bacterium]
MPHANYYDDDPELYISRKFSTFERYWQDVLEKEATDNWEMYNGWDQYIRRRKSENRSSLQLPTLYPAIEGRVSQIMARLTSKEPIIRLRAHDKSDPYQVLSALRVQQWIRDVLDRQNWLEEIAVMMMAAEVFPIVWIKCRMGEIEMTPSEQRGMAEAMGIPPEMMRGQKRTVPEFEILSPGNVYFDYRVKNPHERHIEKFHIKDVTLDEIHERFGADTVRKVEEHESTEPDYIKQWEEAAGRTTYRDRGEPRYRLAEGWINACYKNGKVERRVVRFFPDVVRQDSGDSAIGLLLEDEEPPMSFDPFQPVVSRRLPFHLMGKSTVALGKAFQREAAELTNMAIDILGYTASPPILMEKGAVDNPNQLEFTARSLWLLNDTSFPPQPLHVPTPNAPFLDSVRNQMQDNMNHVTAAYEGITGQQGQSGGRETLGAFRQRTQVGAGRLDIPLLGYARIIAGLTEKYWYYMREFPRTMLARSPVGVQTPMGRQPVTVQDLDVAAQVVVSNLTEFENDEMKKIELDRFIERLAAHPIYQMNPALQQTFIMIYARRHLTDPSDLQEVMMAFQQPLQPELTGAQNGTGMPQTQFSPGVGNIERSNALVGATTAGGG